MTVGTVISVLTYRNQQTATWTKTRATMRNEQNVLAQRHLVDFYRSNGIDPTASHEQVVEKLKQRLQGEKIDKQTDLARARLLYAYEEFMTIVDSNAVNVDAVYEGDFPSSTQVKNLLSLLLPIEEYNAKGQYNRSGRWSPPLTLLWLKGVYLPTRALEKYKSVRDQREVEIQKKASAVDQMNTQSKIE